MPGAGRRGRRVAGTLEDHQFDDAGVRGLRITQEYRPQLIGIGAEEFRPVTAEGVVEQLGESQTVSPEPQ